MRIRQEFHVTSGIRVSQVYQFHNAVINTSAGMKVSGLSDDRNYRFSPTP